MGKEMGRNYRRRIRKEIEGIKFWGSGEGNIRKVWKKINDVYEENVREMNKKEMSWGMKVRWDIKERRWRNSNDR